MGREIKVPITPAVLRWAIDESGFDIEDVAHAADVDPEAVHRWLRGRDRPSLTQARKLSSKLRRQVAVLLLPRVPQVELPEVKFRSLPGTRRRELNPNERNALREAVRVQQIVAWALTQSHESEIRLPHYEIARDAESAATAFRRILAVPDDLRIGWRTPSEALAGWRSAIEQLGVLVFLLPMGKDSCRGFSVWDDRAPLIVANTWWNTEARTYTLLHELGHLLTRTSSACLEPSEASSLTRGDITERWCEEFAAALLLPAAEVEQFLRDRVGWTPGHQISDLQTIARLARRHNASLRATALRLIKANLAPPEVYAAIPSSAEHKKKGGGGSSRKRYEVRRDQLGRRAVRILLDAVGSGILTTSDVLGYLDVGYGDLGALAKEVAPTSSPL